MIPIRNNLQVFPMKIQTFLDLRQQLNNVNVYPCFKGDNLNTSPTTFGMNQETWLGNYL